MVEEHEERYDGIPVSHLPIDEVYVPDPEHLRRSSRYPGAIDIAPEYAVTAAFDPNRRVARDRASRTGEAIRVLGYAEGMGCVLVVVLIPDGHPPTGMWQVATAWPASRKDRAAYYKEER